MSRKPRILILGRPEDGSFEKELHDFLVHIDHAECHVEAKDSVDLTRQAETADLIIMPFASRPKEVRDKDVTTLPALREKQGNLMLFARNRSDLMDVIDELDMRAHRVYKVTSRKDEWQKRLLLEILDWKDAHGAVTSVPVGAAGAGDGAGGDAASDSSPDSASAAAGPKTGKIDSMLGTLRKFKEMVALVVGIATTTLALSAAFTDKADKGEEEQGSSSGVTLAAEKGKYAFDKSGLDLLGVQGGTLRVDDGDVTCTLIVMGEETVLVGKHDSGRITFEPDSSAKHLLAYARLMQESPTFDSSKRSITLGKDTLVLLEVP